MITRVSLLFLLILSTFCATALASSEEIVQRHLSAGPGGKLIVDVDFGTVDVVASMDNQVVVNARRVIETSNDAQEKEFLAAAPITVSQEGNTVTVRSRSNRKWRWSGPHIKMDARYAVQLPKNFNADLRSGGGSISVKKLNGELKGDTAGGSLDVKRVHGPMDVRTSGGNVRLNECEGTMKVRTDGGNIDSLGGNGSLNAHTSGGSVSIRTFAGSVETTTDGGRMDLRDIGGPLTARTSGGSIDATLTNATDANLETSAGAIDLAIPASGGFTIDAKASAGRVTTELPITIERKHDDVLVGKLNGGGKSLYLRTSAGSISITAMPPRTAAISGR